MWCLNSLSSAHELFAQHVGYLQSKLTSFLVKESLSQLSEVKSEPIPVMIEKDYSRIAEQTIFFAFSFLLSSYQTAPFCAWLYADSAQPLYNLSFNWFYCSECSVSSF